MENETRIHNTVVTCVFNYPRGFDADKHAYLYTPLRRERIARASLASVKAQSAAAELAFLAARKLAGMEGGAGYSYSENGKPIIGEGFMSLTHAEGCAAASVSFAPVGVDIENLRNIDMKIASRMLTKDELADLEGAEDRSALLLSYWTAKEACTKLTGEGLAALSKLSYDRGEGAVRDAAGRTYPILRLMPELPQRGGEALLAVCTEGPAKHIIAVFNDAETITAFISGTKR